MDELQSGVDGTPIPIWTMVAACPSAKRQSCGAVRSASQVGARCMCKPSQTTASKSTRWATGSVKPESLQLPNSLWALPLQHVQSKAMPIISAIGPATAAFLLSQEGRAAAEELQDARLDDAHLPALLNRLRRDSTPDRAGALVTLARLRRRAAAKFPRGGTASFSRLKHWNRQRHGRSRSSMPRWLDRHAPPGVRTGPGLWDWRRSAGAGRGTAKWWPMSLTPCAPPLPQANAAGAGPGRAGRGAHP